MPFLVQWKGRLPAGKVYDQPVIQLDILPTAVAAAGGEVKADWKLDGVNLLPYLEGKESGPAARDALLALRPAVGDPPGRLEAGRRATTTTQKEQGPVHETKVTPPQLFNLAEDPGETKDLAAKHPDKVKELQGRVGGVEQGAGRTGLGPASAAAAVIAGKISQSRREKSGALLPCGFAWEELTSLLTSTTCPFR